MGTKLLGVRRKHVLGMSGISTLGEVAFRVSVNVAFRVSSTNVKAASSGQPWVVNRQKPRRAGRARERETPSEMVADDEGGELDIPRKESKSRKDAEKVLLLCTRGVTHR